MSDRIGSRSALARASGFVFGLIAAVIAQSTFSCAVARARCDENAEQKARALGVPPSDVVKITVHAERGTELPLQGYKAWVSLRNCRGYLVVNLDDQCSPVDAYTTRDCEISGVPNY